MQKLDGQVALITGGSSGIGLATAQLFAKEGARIIITGRNQEKLAQAQKTLPDSTQCVASDISKLADIKTLIGGIIENQKIDIIVFCSGVCSNGTLLEITEDQFDNLMNINTKGVLFSIQEAVRQNAFNKNAKIVILTSTINKKGFPGFASYAASKGALLLIMQTLALELYKDGIRVNAVCPGATKTGILRGLNCTDTERENIEESIGQSLPYGARAEPMDIAEAILFLASDDSKFVIGTEFVVDGGQTC